MVQFMLSLALTLWCCSVPVYVACVWRRLHTTDVVQGPPADVRPTQVLNRSIPSSTLIMASIHGQDFSRLSLHRQNRVLGLSFTWFASILLHDQCLISLPLRDMGFWPHYVICVALGMIIWINVWIAPYAEDAEDSYMFSKRDRLLLLLVDLRRVHMITIIRLLTASTQTQHRRC